MVHAAWVGYFFHQVRGLTHCTWHGAEGAGLRLALAVVVLLGLGNATVEAEVEAEGLLVALPLGDIVGGVNVLAIADVLGLGVALALGNVLVLGDTLARADIEVLPLGDVLVLALGEEVGLLLKLGLLLGDADVDELPETETLPDDDKEGDEVGVGLGLELGVRVAEAVVLGVGEEDSLIEGVADITWHCAEQVAPGGSHCSVRPGSAPPKSSTPSPHTAALHSTAVAVLAGLRVQNEVGVLSTLAAQEMPGCAWHRSLQHVVWLTHIAMGRAAVSTIPLALGPPEDSWNCTFA